MNKRLTSLIGFFLLMLLLLPVNGKAEETGINDTEKYHAVYVG